MKSPKSSLFYGQIDILIDFSFIKFIDINNYTLQYRKFYVVA